MAHLTTLDELNRHITLLSSVEESNAPFISAYLNLENGQAGWREELDDRARILRRVLKGNDLADLVEALGKIEIWLATDLLPEAKGRLSLCVAPSAAPSCCRCSLQPPCPTGLRSIPRPTSITW